MFFAKTGVSAGIADNQVTASKTVKIQLLSGTLCVQKADVLVCLNYSITAYLCPAVRSYSIGSKRVSG